jgi:CelD/BcsL family acetyltransferase involved in cellulose biosynthesis
MTKKFAADGGTLELLVDSTHLARGLDAFQQVYRAKWKKEEPFPQFIPGLVQTCAERGWLRLGVAWHNGQPIAAQLWIVANGKANIYKVAYNEDFKPYAPGTLLTALLMAHVIEQDRVTEVDFLIGDDPYKKTWMSHRRERWGIIAYNPKTLGGLLGLGK